MPFPILARGTRTIRQADFAGSGATIDLPYSDRNPETNLNLFSEGLLRVQLGVSGQGVFDAEDAWVLLRRPSLIRDQLEVITGQRRLPTDREPVVPDFRAFPVPNRHRDLRAR